MIFDKVKVNDQTFSADGQLSVDDSLVKITTTDGAIGQFFNQVDMQDQQVDIAIYNGNEERLNKKQLKLDNITVVGGNYRIELAE